MYDCLCFDIVGFAEKLYNQLESTTERFEVKLMMINLISRLVGIHEVSSLILYSTVCESHMTGLPSPDSNT